MSNVVSTPGKAKGYALVRDKDGGIKVDDWDALDPELRKIIEEELANGGHLSNN